MYGKFYKGELCILGMWGKRMGIELKALVRSYVRLVIGRWGHESKG